MLGSRSYTGTGCRSSRQLADLEQKPAIDWQKHTRDIARLVGSEEHCGIGQVNGIASVGDKEWHLSPALGMDLLAGEVALLDTLAMRVSEAE